MSSPRRRRYSAPASRSRGAPLAAKLGSKDRHGKTSLDRPLEADVERLRAQFGAWYELFPRSWGGFKGVKKVLPGPGGARLRRRLSAADPPDRRHEPQGPQQRAEGGARATPAAPGRSASAEGGHDAIHPELGTLKEFDDLVAAARKAGLEVALDFAIQTSPDHPWLTEHPDWFNRRPDGTLKYAENPPKRYQDIYNVNFDSEDWPGLWEALKDVVVHWCRHGVRAFRVDNPHTKSVPFWEWLIAEVRDEFPDTVFFAEAFTRPAMMTTLAKIGFSQSYTYFTWKNTKWELIEFLNQQLEWSAYYRPNFFANTPDILHEYLQEGGRPAFELRLVLASTLSPSYGIYSGYEHFENVPVAHGSEEYLDSEKYEVKQRSLDGPLLPLVKRLNEIRRAEPALQRFDNLHLLDTHGEHVFAYYKAPDIAVAANLDPTTPREDVVVVPPHLGLPDEFPVRDLLTGERYRWRDRAKLRWPRARRRACDEDRRCVSEAEHPHPVHWFESNPNWFKTAVFYEIHTRAFFDGNDDGSGDFRGLQQKLDYLQWLGIDCIWMLPFYPSPSATAATTSPTSTGSTPTTARSRTSAPSSRRRTSGGCA